MQRNRTDKEEIRRRRTSRRKRNRRRKRARGEKGGRDVWMLSVAMHHY